MIEGYNFVYSYNAKEPQNLDDSIPQFWTKVSESKNNLWQTARHVHPYWRQK